jgi:hypothetical protein
MDLQIIVASTLVLASLFIIERLIGIRWAAFTACLPLTSGPLVVATTMKFGVPVAQQFLVGCVIATGAASLTLYVFGRLRHKPITLSMLLALLVFLLIVAAQQQLNNLVEISAALAFGLILLTTVMIGSATPVQKTSPSRSSGGSVALPCLILIVCLATISFLPPRWSGVLASAPLVALSFLVGLRRSGNSPQTVFRAVASANQGLMVKLVLFCTAYALLETSIAWEAAYIFTLAITVGYFSIVKAIVNYFKQPYNPPLNKHPLATKLNTEYLSLQAAKSAV